jgi:hypothetical protein
MKLALRRPGPAPKNSTYLVWDTYRQTVEHAKRKVAELAGQGTTVIGCSLDSQVKRRYVCPVCGTPGLIK